jgi:hypothetical protein
MSDAMATNEALGAPNPAGQLAVRPPAETSDAERSAGNAEELAPMLAREGLTLEEVLPSDAGGWVRMLSALETEDRSWPFGALAEIVDAFVLDSTAMPTSAPRAVKIDVDADAQGSVTRFTVAADGAGMTQAQMAALVGAPGAHDSMPEQGALGGGGGNISPALLQTGRACLAVTRAAEDSSIGRAVMALVSREPLVGGGGGGGLGGGRGNYVMPLTVVNAEGKPVGCAPVRGSRIAASMCRSEVTRRVRVAALLPTPPATPTPEKAGGLKARWSVSTCRRPRCRSSCRRPMRAMAGARCTLG